MMKFDLVEKCNDILTGFDSNLKIGIRSKDIHVFTITSDKELTQEHLDKIAQIYKANFEEKFPGSSPEIKILIE